MASKIEREYLNRVAEIGCIICRMPAEIHHLRTGMGIGMRNDYKNAIPLCPTHHRTGGHGVAYHAGKVAFESQFGTETELLEKVRNLL